MASNPLPRRENISKASGASVACTPCRRIKIKCVVDTGIASCNRCRRKNLECFFESHRRGRRPGSRTIASPKLCNTAVVDRSEHHLQQQNSISEDHDVLDNEQHVEVSITSTTQGDHVSPIQQSGASLAPAGLLSAEAVTGKFSLENVFRFPGSKPSSRKANQCLTRDQILNSRSDTIALGLVSMPIARNLFDSFMNYLNPYVVHLDPYLHTFELVQRRSSFLLTVVLCTAARIFNESVHRGLYEHAEKLLASFMVSCEKSIESIQAMLLLTYWKDSSDSRSWHFVGHAIRMGTAMNWHKLGGVALETEAEIREQRNKERTWMILFVYDRSISFQLGRPWMQHADDFIRNARDWHLRPFAVPGNDHLLVAFLQLRMIGAENLDFWPSASSSDNAILERCLDTYFEELETWEVSWCDSGQEASLPIDFMTKFYGAHFRLLLSSSRLQLAQIQGTDRLDEYVQSCLASGDYIFRVLLDKLAPFQQLYYVQDSIHVMIAYTTILLIKILLSANAQIPPPLERSTVQTILEASDVFASQSSTLRSSCIDQARFLKSAAKEYRRWKTRGDKEQAQRVSREAGLNETDGVGNLQTDMLPARVPNGFSIEETRNVDVSGYNYAAGPDISPNTNWEALFGVNATGFEFDNWSLLPLSAPI